MTFSTKLHSRLAATDSAVCVGLDSRWDKLPECITSTAEGVTQSIVSFNQQVILATHQVAACYKMNVAFYAGFGAAGLEALAQTNHYLQQQHPDIPRIADCKRSEMGQSVQMVKQEMVDWLGFDCVMVTPWFGFDTVEEYLQYDDVGVSVYIHDSNPTATEFQALDLASGQKVFEYVAERVAHHWNKNGNVFVEAGATYPEALHSIREIIGPEMVILVAGVGAQGGKVEDLKGLFGEKGQRLLVNSSRGIIFAGEASDAQDEYFEKVRLAAERLRDELRFVR